MSPRTWTGRGGPLVGRSNLRTGWSELRVSGSEDCVKHGGHGVAGTRTRGGRR